LLLGLWRLDRLLMLVAEWAVYGARWLQRFAPPTQKGE
jgi:hypothetical protein